MIETRRLKNVVIFIQTILLFVVLDYIFYMMQNKKKIYIDNLSIHRVIIYFTIGLK